MLEKSSVWSVYKDQKHDLFIQQTQFAGYLTGPVGVAGYLTAGTSTTTSAIADEPPPMDPPHDEEADD